MDAAKKAVRAPMSATTNMAFGACTKIADERATM